MQLLRHAGVDIVSRNVYCDQRRVWFGGLSDIVWDGVDVVSRETAAGQDLTIERSYNTPAGQLGERQRYAHLQSTLVQERFLVDDYATQLDAYQRLVEGRRWRFAGDRYDDHQRLVGDDGLVVAGELYSPLKMLHLDLGAENTTYLLMDHPARAAELMRMHQAAQLDLARQIVEWGVPAIMAMDNLDTMLHSPEYVERYSAPFYEQASHICHAHGSTFWIHACGQQRANLKLIASLGVDGLEGVAFPPLGDVELDEAMKISGDRFLMTGGITAAETDHLQSREAVFQYVRQLLERMAPYAHRFIFASSCNTAITARWEQLVWFRDAWLEYGQL
ncbi:MAG: uroporphyrinogen decarboxylase family protein [Pirellulales bacterium]